MEGKIRFETREKLLDFLDNEWDANVSLTIQRKRKGDSAQNLDIFYEARCKS